MIPRKLELLEMGLQSKLKKCIKQTIYFYDGFFSSYKVENLTGRQKRSTPILLKVQNVLGQLGGRIAQWIAYLLLVLRLRV